MAFDWSTFILEIINFLVLVWILKRFLYHPVLTAMARRQADLEAQASAAKADQQAAEALRTQFDIRLQQWEQEKSVAREALQAEINAQRQQLSTALEAELAAERQRQAAIDSRRLEEHQQQATQLALAQAARFAATLLERLATPELERTIVRAVLEDLDLLPAGSIAGPLSSQTEFMRSDSNQGTGNGNGNGKVRVSSAHALPADLQISLGQALERLCGCTQPIVFDIDTTLLAGLRIQLGTWNLQASLADELRHFSEAANHAT